MLTPSTPIGAGKQATRSFPMHAVQPAAAARTFANIVVSANGLPIASVITGRHRLPTGSFSSTKAGVGQPWIRHELRTLIHRLEADTDVTDYRSFPHRLEFVSRGRKTSFVPHAAADLACGSVEILNISRSGGSGPVDRDRVVQIYAALGWTFRDVDAGDLKMGSERALLVERILDHKDVFFSSGEAFIVYDVIAASGGSASVRVLAAALGESARGSAILCAMSIKRLVMLDPDRPLDLDAPVRLPDQRRPAGAPTFKLWEALRG